MQHRTRDAAALGAPAVATLAGFAHSTAVGLVTFALSLAATVVLGFGPRLLKYLVVRDLAHTAIKARVAVDVSASETQLSIHVAQPSPAEVHDA